MKNVKNKTQSDTNSTVFKKEQEAYEIIYADPRDEEIHLKFLKRTQLNAHMARWFLDHEYNQLIWSDGVYEILELDARKSGASNSSFIGVVHPEDRQVKIDALEEIKKSAKPVEINYRLQFSDGRVKWINEICNTDFDRNGSPIRSYGTIQEITKYKVSEELFRQREDQFRNLIDSIPIGIAIIQGRKFSFINPAGGKILMANSPDELIGKPISTIIHPASKKEFLNKIKSVLNGHREPTFEERFIRSDASVFDAEVTLIATTFQSNAAIQLIVNDITDRKKAERLLNENEIRLKEVIEAKDKFLSIIAHDLRSPFNSILGFLNLLQDQYEQINDSERKSYLTLIDDSVNKTLKLLENLLEWAKSQSGKVAFQPIRQKLLPIIENASESMNSALKLKKIKLSYAFPESLEIDADSNMLSTIFQNLLSNAIKYSYPEGEIVISARSKDDKIEITVSDYGTGIPDEVKDKLFRIDEQVITIGTSNEKGSGLGLILCKDFISMHEGEIWVESELGKGSRFIFTIPFLEKQTNSNR